MVEIRKLIDQQISRGVAPSLAVVTSVLSYFYSWTSSKVQLDLSSAASPPPRKQMLDADILYSKWGHMFSFSFLGHGGEVVPHAEL